MRELLFIVGTYLYRDYFCMRNLSTFICRNARASHKICLMGIILPNLSCIASLCVWTLHIDMRDKKRRKLWTIDLIIKIVYIRLRKDAANVPHHMIVAVIVLYCPRYTFYYIHIQVGRSVYIHYWEFWSLLIYLFFFFIRSIYR